MSASKTSQSAQNSKMTALSIACIEPYVRMPHMNTAIEQATGRASGPNSLGGEQESACSLHKGLTRRAPLAEAPTCGARWPEEVLVRGSCVGGCPERCWDSWVDSCPDSCPEPDALWEPVGSDQIWQALSCVASTDRPHANQPVVKTRLCNTLRPATTYALHASSSARLTRLTWLCLYTPDNAPALGLTRGHHCGSKSDSLGWYAPGRGGTASGYSPLAASWASASSVIRFRSNGSTDMAPDSWPDGKRVAFK